MKENRIRIWKAKGEIMYKQEGSERNGQMDTRLNIKRV